MRIFESQRRLLALLLVVLTIVTVLTLAIGYVLSRQKAAVERLNTAISRQHDSHRLAEQLRQSSDDLTRMVRSYAATGDSVYWDSYHTILDIREGKAPRPAGYERISWDFVAVGDTTAVGEDGEKIALLKLMDRAGFADEELRLLTTAKLRSDTLVGIEETAMSAVDGRFLDETGALTIVKDPDREMALRLLFDENYHRAKSAVMRPINDALTRVDKRTAEDVAAANRKENSLNVALTYLVRSLLIAMPLLVFLGHRYHTASTAVLATREELFRSTFEQAAVGIAHTSPHGVVLRVNQRFCDIIGYTREEILGRSYLEITHPDDAMGDVKHMKRQMSGELADISMSKRYLRKDGETVWVERTANLIRDEAGDPMWYATVVQDITEQRRLQRERDRILDLSQDLICTAGMDGYFKYINLAAGRLLGYTEEELLTRPFLDFVHPEDRDGSRLEVASLAAGNPTLDFENRYICKDGSIRHFSWVVTPLPDENTMYCIARDITARKEAEQELRENRQRLRSLASQLILAEERERRSIAADLHDHVGQALALTRLQLARTLKAKPQRDQLAEQLDDVSQTVRQAIQDTRNLIFELSSPTLDELGLGPAITEWMNEQIEGKHGLRVKVVDDAEDAQLGEDLSAILFRSVRELLTNVVKHARATSVCLCLEEDAGQLCATVQDDGVGFDPESLSRSDRGFGLFSIRERMSDLGGSLEVVSRPGGGCTAIMYVPITPPSPIKSE